MTKQQKYEAVKNFIETSNNIKLIRSLAIELLDNGNNYEELYDNWKSDLTETKQLPTFEDFCYTSRFNDFGLIHYKDCAKLYEAYKKLQ
jgi:hypothetical protein